MLSVLQMRHCCPPGLPQHLALPVCLQLRCQECHSGKEPTVYSAPVSANLLNCFMELDWLMLDAQCSVIPKLVSGETLCCKSYCPIRISPIGNLGCFSWESQLRQNCVTQPMAHTECLHVSLIHQTLSWTMESLTCTQMLMNMTPHGDVRTP